MKKMNVKRLVAIAGTMAMVMGMTACGSTDGSNANASASGSNVEVSEENTKISGKVSMSGSTSMEKLVKALQETFAEKEADVTVTTEFVGSSAGVEQMLSGTVDIGNSSRNLKDAEKESGAVENIVAIDGIAMVVDTANTVADLTKDELVAIYTGTVTNWSEVGGADAPIVVIGREAGSGTRGAFEEILKIEEQCKYASELDSTGAVMAKVSATPGAIGYVSLDALNDTVKAVSLEGVEATAENILAGNYFLSRPFVMATKGAIEEQSEAVQAFFTYVFSEEGQAVVQQVGLIPVK
ncbi:MAG: phosphate ABC transporter substrate-binding protein [Lachnospiraceae bacterium]|nr:phosphate ABC transporter substrate-binding protein [Lachnospiraceae bacterium]